MKKPIRTALLFAVGALLLQTAWILAVPPFRGIDEFDHAYRANSVAEGYWRTWEEPDDGRGDLIPVRRNIIEDAREICRSYDYPGPDNCRPVEDLGEGMATVASAASRYHPVYYWVVGQPSLLLEGAGGLYAMRWLASILCAAVIALIAGLIAQASRSIWPLAGFGLALTPVVVYSTSLPAPNGVEMLAGAGLWVCLLALRPARPDTRTLLLAAIVMTVVLVTVRPLGTLWLILVVLTATTAIGPGCMTMPLRSHPRLTRTWVGATLVSVAVAAAWYVSARTHEIDLRDGSGVNRWNEAAGEIPVWIMQSIAAFPLRDQAAPPVVYALILLPFVAMVSAAWIVGGVRQRCALLLGAFLSLAAPFVFTVMTVTRHGTIWQGRYTLPLAVGLTILAGFVLAESRRHFRLGRPFALLLGLGVMLGQVVSVVSVQLRETDKSPLAGDDRWVQVPVTLTAVLALLGVASWYLAVFGSQMRGEVPARAPEAQETHA